MGGFTAVFLLCWSLHAAIDDERSPSGEQPPVRTFLEHWSFQPIRRPAIPELHNFSGSASPRNAIDAFVWSRLEQVDLQPAAEADRRTLIRRLTFDLTGLPPSSAEIDEFLPDSADDAYERLVDRLLASPRYGERWGQHWLDVVRFAESEGFEYDRHQSDAWRYRDYVIRSLNDDKAFDRFVREQLAGDEIAPDDPEAQVAVGFHRLGPVRRNAGNPEIAFSRNEVLTSRTDIVGSAFLGLSLGCARCHDHKFDPISQADYYRMQAFFAASDEFDIPLASDDARAAWQSRADAVNAEIKAIKESMKAATGSEKQQFELQLEAAESRLPPPLPTHFSVRNAMEKRSPIYILRRGDDDKRGDAVGPRVLPALAVGNPPELPADNASPRTILADWITSTGNPLTARVLVNRVWQWHFGCGIVETANDFGANGQRPSHPDLLDYLAGELIQNGWSIKSIHRLICLSGTYRQSRQSSVTERGMAIDPTDRLLWRYRSRRLEAEEIRDAMLCASGNLNGKSGGPSVLVPVDEPLVKLLYKPSQWTVTADSAEWYRRSVYLIAKRNLRLPFMEVFDQPALQTSCARRESSTHAPQALELLNGRLANELAGAFADRLAREAGPRAMDQVELAFVLAVGRPPTDGERRAAESFLSTQPLREFALAMFNLNGFLYVE